MYYVVLVSVTAVLPCLMVSCLGFKHHGDIYCLALVLLDKNGLLVVSPHVLPIQST